MRTLLCGSQTFFSHLGLGGGSKITVDLYLVDGIGFYHPDRPAKRKCFICKRKICHECWEDIRYVTHEGQDRVCQIGKRVTIGHGAIVHCRSIGDEVTVGMGAILSLQARIGEHSIIAEGCIVKNKQELPDHVVAAGNPAKVVRSVTHVQGDGKQHYHY